MNFLEETIKENKVLAIGEIGLDYYHSDDKENQAKLFINQINLAKKYNLPIVIHTREAGEDTVKILRENADNLKVLIHCFSPNEQLVRLVLEKGYTVAFGGNITFKRNAKFYEYVKQIPLDQIVLETDCPYMTPIPFKGEVNDSSKLKYILDKLAEIKEIDKNELANIVYENSIKFFNI